MVRCKKHPETALYEQNNTLSNKMLWQRSAVARLLPRRLGRAAPRLHHQRSSSTSDHEGRRNSSSRTDMTRAAEGFPRQSKILPRCNAGNANTPPGPSTITVALDYGTRLCTRVHYLRRRGWGISRPCAGSSRMDATSIFRREE